MFRPTVQWWLILVGLLLRTPAFTAAQRAHVAGFFCVHLIVRHSVIALECIIAY